MGAMDLFDGETDKSYTAASIEVLEGLEAGQKIATAGLQTLLNGQEVRLSP